MDPEQKAIARQRFKLMIHEADGQKFEDLFTRIMSYAEPNFKPIKPQGKFGDRKNDGYIKSKAAYYQVFAPEDITKSHAATAAKLKEDLEGLLKNWEPVRKFYFVLNDKYKGPYADAEQQIAELRENYGLEESDFFLAKDLENTLFNLEDDQILEVTNCPYDPTRIANLDFSVLHEVIQHLMQQPVQFTPTNDMMVPNWDRKIEFNELSPYCKTLLDNAAFNIGRLDEYLNAQGDFASQELRDKAVDLYLTATKFCAGIDPSQFPGDGIFLKMLEDGVPRQAAAFQYAFFVVLAKYFETCDVFEKPEDGPC